MLARLTVHLPRQPTRTFFLREGREYVVGRDPDSDLVLEDGRVSRAHARLAGVAGGFELTNLDSKNGLTLDGKAVESSRLEGPCWIGFGGLVSRFEPLDERAAWQAERRRKLETTVEAHRKLRQESSSVGPLLKGLLGSVIEVGHAERGFVLLAADDGDFRIVASAGMAPRELAEDEFRGSVSAVSRVLANGSAIAESDVLDDTFLGGRPSIVRGEIRALVCLPLLAAGRSIGAIYADSRRPGAAFDELDLEILGALADHAALAVWVAGLDHELKSLAGNLPTEVATGVPPGALGLSGYPSWSMLQSAAGAVEKGAS